MFNKILVPLDGSEISAQAITRAGDLAKQTGASITFLQVVDSEAQLLAQISGMTIEPMPVGEVTVDAARSAVQAQREQAQATLNAAIAQVGGNASGEIREGQAGDVIVEAAKELGVDVVIMATHGRGGFKRAILGSVADHVVRHLEGISVLLVKPDAD